MTSLMYITETFFWEAGCTFVRCVCVTLCWYHFDGFLSILTPGESFLRPKCPQMVSIWWKKKNSRPAELVSDAKKMDTPLDFS